MDFEKCREAFEKYVDAYDKTDKDISLKYYHSYAVADLMAELGFRLGLTKKEIILGKIIGLLHDLGRFEQLKSFGTYSDQAIDHAEEGYHYLFKDGHIRDFMIDTQYDDVIESAIRYHNKLKIPPLEGKKKLFTEMIRDMDKVDIYKQCAIHYPMVFDVLELNQEILKDFKDEKLINRTNRDSKSETLLITLSFIFDINFEESFDILVETDNFDLYLSTVEVKANSENIWKKIKEICFDKINRGVTLK